MGREKVNIWVIKDFPPGVEKYPGNASPFLGAVGAKPAKLLSFQQTFDVLLKSTQSSDER